VNIQNYLLLWNRFPRLSLLLVTVPLLVLNGYDHSLIPHDEGYYAIQARWIWETGDWLTPQWWGTPIYDRTIGLQWLIALAYHLFGLNEFSLRLPSAIACILGVLLTYEIGKIILDRQIAWLSAAILMLMGLWVNEAHTAQQNTVLVAIELLGIWALLKISDVQPPSLSSSQQLTKHDWVWGVVAGTTVGVGFLIKGFMIFVPIAALLPYLISHQRYRQVLTNPGIYLGLILGAIPTGLWLILSCYKYGGIAPVQELVNKLLFLAKTDDFNPGPFYYLWNLPVNIFPWGLFSVVGAIVLWRKLLPNLNYASLSLTLGYPICLFVLLSLFRTRMPYYMMQLLPFMALLAATAFRQFSQISRSKSISWYRFVTWLGYAFGGLGVVLAIAGALVTLNLVIVAPEVRVYALPLIILGCGWLSISSLWHRWQPPSIPYWLAGWLVPVWFTILSFGLGGALTDKSPDFRTAFARLNIDRVVGNQPVNLLIDTVQTSGFQQGNSQDRPLSTEEHKTLILLSFYTPQLGQQMNNFTQLPDKSYAWTLRISPELAAKTLTIGNVEGWQLIQKIGSRG
jgi:Dolichyl-phosphate-mannose-protein mannosyltransferase